MELDYFKSVLFFLTEKKREADNQEVEVKKKAKELKVLDPKSAQNLCMYCLRHSQLLQVLMRYYSYLLYVNPVICICMYIWCRYMYMYILSFVSSKPVFLWGSVLNTSSLPFASCNRCPNGPVIADLVVKTRGIFCSMAECCGRALHLWQCLGLYLGPLLSLTLKNIQSKPTRSLLKFKLPIYMCIYNSWC